MGADPCGKRTKILEKKKKRRANRKDNPEEASKETVQRPGLYCRNSTLETFDGTTDYHNHRLLTSSLFSLHSPPKPQFQQQQQQQTPYSQFYKVSEPLRGEGAGLLAVQ